MSRSFDLEISDANAELERALERDRHREPRRRPRYPATTERSRQLEARFATLLGETAPDARPKHHGLLDAFELTADRKDPTP